MIEVFKTDVDDPGRAGELLHQINTNFPDYESNFDLSDCDRILRVKNTDGDVDTGRVIQILSQSGHSAECL